MIGKSSTEPSERMSNCGARGAPLDAFAPLPFPLPGSARGERVAGFRLALFLCAVFAGAADFAERSLIGRPAINDLFKGIALCRRLKGSRLRRRCASLTRGRSAAVLIKAERHYSEALVFALGWVFS